MWSEDEDVHAALRGDNAVDPAAEVNWARIIAGLVVLALVAIFAAGAIAVSLPAADLAIK